MSINKTYHLIQLLMLVAVLLGGSILWVIQLTVCNELQEIMRVGGNYNIFTGCVMQIEVEQMELPRGEK